ncbi:cyanophycin synthetase [Singulisphaera acidiphila]|uniref:Cyanophycin synthetase n=1 Tax=Singulisphaera acidiphila (strain ATCC BAA-1392 / DSM 18658 / VKM B-2454 / MOB10) TaxID=886293 RepID=L0DLX7_SINAD|nr:cyanophycin synthetase [Singulisphaera acidiphila]AGA30257.1 cyanophycin synthetase [Singulisphaera acidiphila DSM 18658]
MIVRKVLALRGPNLWTRVPVLEAWLDLAGRQGRQTGEIPGFLDRLIRSFASADSGLDEVTERLKQERDLEGVVALLILELQRRSGSDVAFLAWRPPAEDGVARLAVQYQEEEVGRAALALALSLVGSALDDRPFDLRTELERLRTLTQQVRIGPNSAPIAAAARARGIPFRRLNTDSLIQFGHGVRQRRFQIAFTDRTSAIAESISNDKDLTKEMLRAVGVPVPQGRPVSDVEDAWAAALEVGLPVVIKPCDADHGDGITLNLNTREQLTAAYAAALEVSSNIMVERFAPGAHHRMLVAGDRVIAAARRDSAQVIGDGIHSIAELVEEVNRDPRRGDDASSPLRKFPLDPIALGVLADQGFQLDSIPPPGARVFIRRNSHLRDGGNNVDVTDQVHPEVAARVLDATRVIGLDLAGLDVVAEDIGRPLEEQGGVILEVNASPWLRQHLRPWHDPPQPIGEAILTSLYPEGDDGRIPLIAVTGTSGKTTTTRLIAHLFAEAGRVVGMSTTDGIYVADRRIETGDCSGPQSARTVLLNPLVEVAVLETAQGGILREGLAFDRSHVTVVTNLGEGDHLELRGIDTLEELARVKRTTVEVVAAEGAAVLKADDPLVAAMADHCPGEVIWFARDAEHPVIVRHRNEGGRAVFVRDGAIVLARGLEEESLVLLADVPITHQGRVGFQVENVLATAGAAWSIGLSRESIRSGLASFAGDPIQMPARFNLFEVKGATVVIDFPHNAMALEALIDTAESLPHTRRVLVFAGCNRRDLDVVRQGEVIGDGFDRVILYEDKGNQDRQDGELNILLKQGLRGRPRIKELVEVADENLAIEQALRELEPGDLLIIGVEAIERSLEYVQQWMEINL